MENSNLQQIDALSLSAFLQKVSGVIKASFNQQYWIQVEVSKFSDRGGASHAYFDFIEYDEAGKEIAKARGSLWASNKGKILSKFKQATGSDIQDGMKLLLKLSASFSAQYGFSFVVEDIDPAYTLGDMEAKLKAIRQSLIDNKYYDRNKSLPAPKDFTNVAVISPSGAAGLADFMRESELLQSHSLCQFAYYAATFQGKDAASALSASLRQVYAQHKETPFDALVIIRGGGASSDLAWLNDYELATLVCRIPIPVFTGIGHQVDNTILDEVARIRFDTPSKVSAYIASTIISNAESAINNMLSINKSVKQAIIVADSRLTQHMTAVQNQSTHIINRYETDLEALMVKTKTTIESNLALIEQKLNTYLESIGANAQNMIAFADNHLKIMFSEVIGLSPKKTLERGYAIVRDVSGKVLTSVDKVKSCDNIELEMRDGRVKLKVENG